MQPWILFASLSLLFWGMWGIFGKLASAHMPARSIFMVEAVVTLVVAGVWLLSSGFSFEGAQRGLLWAALAGAMLGLGQACFFLAVSRGNVSLIIGLTALYPLITIAIAFLFLKEHVSWTQGLGLALAAAAIPLLSF